MRSLQEATFHCSARLSYPFMDGGDAHFQDIIRPKTPKAFSSFSLWRTGLQKPHLWAWPRQTANITSDCSHWVSLCKVPSEWSLHHSAVFLLQDPDWQDDANCFFAVVFCLTGPSYKVAMTRWLRKHTLQPWVLQKLGTIETRQNPSRLPSQGVSRQRVPK